MTKREVLLAICETPGWSPPEPVGQQMESFLLQLSQEEWITVRLDGWEATPEALDAYPAFATQLDIADVSKAPVTTVAHVDDATLQKESEDRVALFIWALMEEDVTMRPVHRAFNMAMHGEAHKTSPSLAYPRAIARALLTGEEAP